MVQPETLAEIQDFCAGSRAIVPVGARTKDALASGLHSSEAVLDMRRYRGIVSYDSSEFLITVRGGTTISELQEVLAAKGQYLPFDPVFAARGATIGGSIASGISGSCRLLYGGLRDFMLEVAICNSAGREVRGGGKVVKNTAGFDLPKLVVGSYGRMGVITEATLKVFPAPQGWLTVRYEASSWNAAMDTGLKLLALPLPIAALEFDPAATLTIRLAGPLDSLALMARRVTELMNPRRPLEVIEHSDAEARLWTERAEFGWSAGSLALVRVSVAHHQCHALHAALGEMGDAARHVLSCGASVAWVALEKLDDLATLDRLLGDLKLSGVAVCGPPEFTVLGDRRWIANSERIRHALDPENKFASYALDVALN